jgi:hypothetical protein
MSQIQEDSFTCAAAVELTEFTDSKSEFGLFSASFMADGAMLV